MRTEIRFAGIGGQGSVLASTILAEAVGAAGLEAAQSVAYEAAIRGGAAAGDVVIGDQRITFPWVAAPDYLVAQHQGGIRAHLAAVRSGGVVIADTVYVTEIPASEATVYHVPLTEIADAVGIRRAANMVALAVLVNVSKLVSFEVLEQAVIVRSPAGSVSVNQEAIRRGYEIDVAAFEVSTGVLAN